jgi:two-component system response regulator HydG
VTAAPGVPARLLLVDDDEAAARLLGEVLERESYRVEIAFTVKDALAALNQRGPFDAVLTDLRMPGSSGLDLLRDVRERQPDALVIVLTAFGDAEVTAEAIGAGAYDFISKPYDIGALRTTLARALDRRRLAIARRESGPVTTPTDDDTTNPLMVGHSPAVIQVVKTLARVARTQATVMLQGESGTGKELAARMLHRYSDRADQRLVTANCGAMPEGLLESELFGHVRGAFTGAAAARSGLFREADKGTVFLDEVGDVSPALQARLLRVLQEHEILPVGSDQAVKVDVRIIAATHRDLSALVREGRFREDLYYRLNVVSVTLPPLRERAQDVPLLIDHFLRTLAKRHARGPVAVDPAAQERLLAYDWPGNVRELHNVLERALVLAEQDVIGPEHLPANVRGALPDAPRPPADSPDLISLAELERRHVLRVLRSTEGNREAAARILGISRRTLTRMLQRWEVARPEA